MLARAMATTGFHPARPLGGQPWPSLRALLAGASAAVFLLVVVVALLTTHAVNSVFGSASATVRELQQQDLDVEYVWVETSDLQTATLALLSHVQTGDPSGSRSVEHLASLVHFWLLQYGSTSLTGAERTAYARLLAMDDQSLPTQQVLIHSVATGATAQALGTWNVLNPTFGEMRVLARELLQTTNSMALADMRQVDGRTARTDHRLLLMAFGLIVAVTTAAHLAVRRIVLGPLGVLERAAGSLEQGLLETRVPQPQTGEFGALAASFNRMALSLERARQQERRLHSEALELREANLALGRRQLEAVVLAREEERKRLARDLHDEASQSLAAVQFGLQSLAHHVNSPSARHEAEGLAATVRQTLAELHRLAVDLRPSELDEIGLEAALSEWLDACAARSCHTLRFAATSEGPGLPPGAETAIFRIVQEAVTNVLRHAQAQHISVELVRGEAETVVSVQDDGDGFDAEAVLADHGRLGLGLHGIQERASMLGGVVKILSAPKAGTRLEVHIPVPTLGREVTMS